jgi:hypothetical protein
MKTPGLIFAFAWLAWAVATPATAEPSLEIPRAIHVPAGDMVDAVESLARQCDVDVMYPSAVLKGQTTQGVSGTLAPKAAFGKLLEGTPFEVTENDGALLITKAASTPQAADRFDTLATASAKTPPEPKYQVTVAAARQESLSTLYPRLESLKSQFYVAYNQANDDTRYQVRCKRGSVQLEINLVVWALACSPKLKITCSGGSTTIQQLCTAWPPEGYCEHLFEVVARHPELREILKEYDALAEHYGEVRGEKLKDKIPNDSACRPRLSLPQ